MDKISAGYCYTTSIIRTATIDICAPKSNGWMDLEENVYEDASIKVRDEIGGMETAVVWPISFIQQAFMRIFRVGQKSVS